MSKSEWNNAFNPFTDSSDCYVSVISVRFTDIWHIEQFSSVNHLLVANIVGILSGLVAGQLCFDYHHYKIRIGSSYG